MAKLKGPCFSLGASGQLAKTLVYFPWKGLNALRSYVIPANPRSDAQTTQRGYFEDGVDEWHGAAYNDADKSAWNRLAGIADKIMSGFNRMIRAFVNEAILTNTWTRIHLSEVAGVSATGFVARIYCGTGQPSFRYGTSKTWMPNEGAVVPAGPANQFECDLGGLLVKNVLYYFYWFYGVTGADYGRTGIYSQRTAAA